MFVKIPGRLTAKTHILELNSGSQADVHFNKHPHDLFRVPCGVCFEWFVPERSPSYPVCSWVRKGIGSSLSSLELKLQIIYTVLSYQLIFQYNLQCPPPNPSHCEGFCRTFHVPSGVRVQRSISERSSQWFIDFLFITRDSRKSNKLCGRKTTKQNGFTLWIRFCLLSFCLTS